MLHTDLSIPYLFKASTLPLEQQKLIILVHGYGSNEADLFSFTPELPEAFNVVSVRGVYDLPFGGYSWYDINFLDGKKFSNPTQANASVDAIYKFSKECLEKWNLPEQDVWLCGFSQGAILSYALTLKYPELFQHTICLSGYPSHDIMGEIEKKDFSMTDFFISHGTEDAILSIDWARKGPKLLDELNIKNEYHEYRSGHGIVPQNFYDMKAWIEKRI